jgi:hypothetical protein
VLFILFEGQPIKNENSDLEKAGIFYVLKPHASPEILGESTSDLIINGRLLYPI